MAKKRFKEFRNLSKNELLAKERETTALLFESKMKKTTGQLENTASLWKIRKDLAWIKMLLSQKAE